MDRRALIGDVQRAADLLRDRFIEILDEIHHAEIIGVRLIHFDGSKFGIMEGVHALVAENPAHFVYSVHAADDQAL